LIKEKEIIGKKSGIESIVDSTDIGDVTIGIYAS
jgi:hypothetical protein